MHHDRSEIMIRLCSLEDLPQLRSLAIKTFTDTYAAFNTPEVMADYLERSFSEEQLTRELTTVGSEFYAISIRDRWVGYLKLNEGKAQTEVRSDEMLEIERIYVDRDLQGRGLGKYLLEQAVSVARTKNKKGIWLGVWEHNPKAIRFYESQGFVRNGTHVFMIGGEAQTDWVMELVFT